MKRIAIILLLTAFCAQFVFSQQNLQIIKSDSIVIDVQVDNVLYKKAWRISSEIKPDIFEISSAQVTFYTNRDSISFNVEPDGIYDFVILLNEKDSAYTQIKYKPTRLEMLKKANEYDYNDKRFIPKFTYQTPDDADLVRIRQKFKLDSVAGKGSEILQILNLMHWVHNTVRHDGNSENPNPLNIESIIKVCKEENRGVTCRMIATAMNECYLAMGIKSRFVTCMPKETNFDDCHVINMVYSNGLGKWIWIDAEFDAYVMNEKGELLSIEEVRQRLINDKPLILNPDANWNRNFLKTKNDYLDEYMAKNLYRFQTQMVSEYNAETSEQGKEITYIELLPLDGIEQEPQKNETESKNSGVKWIEYKTNNPELFWAKPD
ncbi:MAG: transglutaminase-like domain-containing protein [Prevotellaceae bacterium]|jgi:transglutaminase-like putative cysteine protease|nr:transglutaminase-like domain-containing protein [Prevotellaceae bacterium]